MQNEICDKIQKASIILNKLGRTGSANWVVATQEIGTTLNKLVEEEEYKEKMRQRILKIEKLKNKI